MNAAPTARERVQRRGAPSSARGLAGPANRRRERPAHCAAPRVSILAQFEFAFNARDGNAKTDDAQEHGAAKAIRQGVPTVEVSGLVGSDEVGEEGLFAGIVFDERKRSVGMDRRCSSMWGRRVPPYRGLEKRSCAAPGKRREFPCRRGRANADWLWRSVLR